MKNTIEQIKEQKPSDSDKDGMDPTFFLVFGFGAMMVVFLGFLTGYFIGTIVLELNFEKSIILSSFTGIGTVFLEAILLIIKTMS